MDVLYGLTKDFVFKEAVAFLKGKRTLTSEEYKMLSDESRAKAFTVSGYTSLEVLQEFLDCLTKAAEEGTTKEQFLEDMNRFLEEHGYEGINPWKCDNIFRTNMQTALNAGHYKSMTDETTMKLRPYWRYRTAGDGHVRESHARRDFLMEQIMEQEGITEELKSRDQMEWVRRANNARSRVDEIILNELVYV